MKAVKRNLTLLVFAALSVNFAFAQFSNVKSSSSFSSYSDEIVSSYSRVYAGYNALSFGGDWKSDATSESKMGLTVGLLRANNVTGCKIPLYIEYGIEATWNKYTEKFDDYDEYFKDEVNLLSFSVPINLSYKFDIPNSIISISPFVGINAKVHAVGKIKYTNFDYPEESYKGDFFDETDAKRFQLGMNVGVGVNINKLYIGYKFQPDLMPILDEDGYKVKANTNMITIGYNF